MQEEMTAQLLTLIFKTADWGIDTFLKGATAVTDEINKPRGLGAKDFVVKDSEQAADKGKERKQAVDKGNKTAKNLVGKEAKKADINDSGISSFTPSARKYDVTIKMTKDPTTTPPTYTVFLEGKNMADITAALKDFVGKEEKTRDKDKDKPKAKSVNKELEGNKEKIKNKDKALGAKEKSKKLEKPSKGDLSR